MIKYMIVSLAVVVPALAWLPAPADIHPTKKSTNNSFRLKPLGVAPSMSIGSLHGQDSCFLPLKQLDQDYYSPRIVQVRFFLIAHISCLSLVLSQISDTEQLFLT
jgi:hypothetical protein